MRSLLFVPGDDARKLEKGLGTDADALIFDLEDSVAEARKDQARHITAQALHAETSKQRFVRLNPFDTGRLPADLDAALAGRPDGVILPKANSARAVQRLEAWKRRHGDVEEAAALAIIEGI